MKSIYLLSIYSTQCPLFEKYLYPRRHNSKANGLGITKCMSLNQRHERILIFILLIRKLHVIDIAGLTI